MTFDPSQWALAIFAAALVGLSKTGISGLGLLPVVLFAQMMPAKHATGLVLPLLCFGDLAAVLSYRQHATWRLLWRLFPWVVVGVFAGYFALGRINETQTRLLIGGIVLVLVALHLYRRRAVTAKTQTGSTARGHESARMNRTRDGDGTQQDERCTAVSQEAAGPQSWVSLFASLRLHSWLSAADGDDGVPLWFAPTIGVLAGFTTLVANAAGPLMVIYLLAMRLPKLEFMGTGAVFFMLLNLFKVPFMVNLGLITHASLSVNLLLAPAVFAGAFLGRKVLHHINQRWFENLALLLSVIAALELMFKFSSHLRIALASAPLWRG